tara:strand:+ start:223 stop:345 length:123 start_codon:yes stop_codon:yes gene_type:complete
MNLNQYVALLKINNINNWYVFLDILEFIYKSTISNYANIK